jgi:hypothetical protein
MYCILTPCAGMPRPRKDSARSAHNSDQHLTRGRNLGLTVTYLSHASQPLSSTVYKVPGKAYRTGHSYQAGFSCIVLPFVRTLIGFGRHNVRAISLIILSPPSWLTALRANTKYTVTRSAFIDAGDRTRSGGFCLIKPFRVRAGRRTRH